MDKRRVHRESEVRGVSASASDSPEPPPSTALMHGRVIEAVGGVYAVELEDGRELPAPKPRS